MTIFEEIEQLEQEAAVFGLQWETSDQIMTQIRNECLEREEHLHSPEQREALQDEIGDLLHAKNPIPVCHPGHEWRAGPVPRAWRPACPMQARSLSQRACGCDLARPCPKAQP